MLGLREHLDHQLGERRLLVELQHERLVLVERLLEVVLAVADEVPVSQPGRWTVVIQYPGILLLSFSAPGSPDSARPEVGVPWGWVPSGVRHRVCCVNLP